jgi:hypothetical protein
MKILIGANNCLGSNIMASRIINHLSSIHEIRIAAYYKNHQYLKSIDWCLDALYQPKFRSLNYFKEKFGVFGPNINHNLADLIINNLSEWNPNLVISDCEFFTAMVAKVLEVPLYYCSPLLQIVGIHHVQKELDYNLFGNFRKYFNLLPIADFYLIYSPLCDISCRPVLKDGFEWIRPYYNKPNIITENNFELDLYKKCISNSLITTGETSFISDCLYSGKQFFVSPNPLELEQILNGHLSQWYGVARNIGRSNNIDFIKKEVDKKKIFIELNIKKTFKTLDERLIT